MNRRRYSTTYFERDLPSPPSSLSETIGATIGYRLAPVGDRLYNAFTYGDRREPDYNPLDHLEGYEQFAEHLAQATNAAHMADLKSQINRNMERRQVLADATFGVGLAAGLFDPINLIALPVGGPVVGVGRAALRAGASVAALEAAYEVGVMQQFDPLQSAEESTLNIAMAGLFGGAIGGVVNIPASIRARTFQNTMQSVRDQFAVTRRLENLDGLTPDDIANAAPRAEREFGRLSDEEIQTRANELNGEAEALRKTNDPSVQSRIEEVDAQAQTLRNELGIRSLEADGIDMADPYRIMPSWFTESTLFKAVTTPMKRALQSEYPTAVKEAFVRTFNDSGLALSLNAMGKATPLSVFQKTAAANGRWVATYDELSKLWSQDVGVSVTQRLDINMTDLALRAKRSQNTFQNWRERINELRMKGTEGASEIEIKAVEVLNRYFDDAKVRLEDVGLIGSKRGLEVKIDQLQAEITAVQARASKVSQQLRGRKLSQKRTTRLNEMKSMIDERLEFLNREIGNSKIMSMALEAGEESMESFLPRFWNHKSIRQNRSELEEILFRWYTENPTIVMINKKTGRLEEKKLSTAEPDVRARAKETVDTILNESDPTSIDSISFGYGRSKHFRHRQVDIPNRLVSKFIETDPLSVMKTYSMRIEPRYEYAREFGKDVDGVLLDMKLDMMDAGASTKQINQMNRDYRHMYDRVAGAVMRNPDSWDSKAAFILKELAQANYMGSAGLAALPDFGRIVMEYDMPNIIKGVQALMDRHIGDMAVDEVRKAGEAIDLLRQTAHLRLSEGMSNNVETNQLWTKARNAFFILNGLGPMTGIAKQLAGIIDSHTIIDYSIRLTKGQLDKKSTIWLARYGIDIEKARRIADQPFEKTDGGLYLANTDKWADPDLVASIAESRLNYTPPKMRFSKMSDANLSAHFAQEFEGVTIITDPKIVGDYFARLKDRYGPLLGFMTDMRDIPNGGFSVHLDRDAIRNRFERLKADKRSGKEIIDDAKERLDRGELAEDMYHHIVNEVNAAGLFEDVDDYFEFILMHELHHSRVNREVGESVASHENRIDNAAIDYIKNQRDAGRQLALEKEIDLVTREQSDLVQDFRSSLNSGVLNTIMSGTPADKPIVTDGVVYIPMSVAKGFGMNEDPQFTGYARIESGLLSLPFQFYSYTLANVNKTVGALATGQVKNRAVGIATMMGLAYLSLKLRTPDYVWEDMSWQDKFARSFDMSGVMALYSDLFYTSMHTSLALGGPNITNGIIGPKFPQQQSVLDAVTGLAGAGPSWAVDVGQGAMSFAFDGDYAGAKTVVRNLPFARLWFWKDEMNQITHAWVN